MWSARMSLENKLAELYGPIWPIMEWVGLASPTLDRGRLDGCHRCEPKGERINVTT